MPVIAAGDARGLLRHRARGVPDRGQVLTPVIVLSDGYLANGAEPWLIPELDACRASRRVRAPNPRASSPTCATRRRSRGRGRCPARPGSSTGSAASRRRTSRVTSRTTREPRRHDAPARAEGGGHRRRQMPPSSGQRPDGHLLVVGWGGTYGTIPPAVDAPAGRARRRPHPRAPPVAAAAISARCCGVPPRCSCRSSTSGSSSAVLRRSFSSTPSAQPMRGMPFRAREAPRSGRSDCWDRGQRNGSPTLTAKTSLRPGSPLVPRLRRLRDPGAGAEVMPELGVAPREHRVRLRHRLLAAVPLLHEHVRVPHDPRPGAGHRHRASTDASRALGVGGDRRRRRPVDRRQPLHPRPAAQRRTSRSCSSTTGSTG